MRNTAQRDTSAELELRRELHRRGFRYRVDEPIVGVTRGRPDLVFPTERVAVFVDGCFWHSCPDHATVPMANREWWIEKLRMNAVRDLRHTEELTRAGWTVIRLWEHQNAILAADEIELAVKRRRASH